MRAAHVDANQQEIISALRGVGASVEVLTPMARGGLPDLLVGYRGTNYLLEVKVGDGRLRRRQPAWHAEWRGQVAVVRTAWEGLLAIGAVEVESPSREG